MQGRNQDSSQELPAAHHSSLLTNEEGGQLEPVVSPETVEEVNELGEIQFIDASLDLSSDPDSEAAYNGGISDNSH